MNRIILCLILLVVAGTSNAISSKWFIGKIKKVYPLSTGNFVLIFKENNPQCTNSSKYHYVSQGENGVTREGVKALLSTSLTAATTSRKVHINFDADSSSCFINRMLVEF